MFPPPLGLYRKAWVCPTSPSKPGAPPASSQGHSLQALSFTELEGDLHPPGTLCPGSGHSLACLRQAWPRFSLQPRLHSSVQGSRNRDPRWDQGPAVGAALLFLGVSGHTGITTAASVGGTACYCYGQPLPPPPFHKNPAIHPRLWQSNFRTLAVSLPTLWQGREKLGWVENAFSGGACSPTLCLGHFKVKFSSMNVQPVSKEKFLW